jgi:hypothetical protein
MSVWQYKCSDGPAGKAGNSTGNRQEAAERGYGPLCGVGTVQNNGDMLKTAGDVPA